MTELESARVPQGQLALFDRPSVHDIATRYGIRGYQLTRLHHDGLLTFEPFATRRLHPAQEAELDFLCALHAIVGHGGLAGLLAGLEAPYSYRLDLLSFDFRTRQWRLREAPDIDDRLEVLPAG